jgi:phosphopantetheine--protein transferase-like protein
MILGIGIDSVEIARVAAKCRGEGPGSQHASRLMEKMFTAREIARSQRNVKDPYQHLAACFAAREAFFKATQVWYHRQDVSVAQHPSGEPYYVLGQEIERRLRLRGAVLYADSNAESYSLPVQVRLSLTHDDTYATAFAIFELLQWTAGPPPEGLLKKIGAVGFEAD